MPRILPIFGDAPNEEPDYEVEDFPWLYEVDEDLPVEDDEDEPVILTAAVWNPSLHPRGRDGKFINGRITTCF